MNLPATEALLLAVDLVDDPTTRIHAKLAGWAMALPVWLDLVSTSTTVSDVEVLTPPPVEKKLSVTVEQMGQATQVLDSISAI